METLIKIFLSILSILGIFAIIKAIEAAKKNVLEKRKLQ